MGRLVIRNLEEEVKARLQRRAARHGRSLEAELREILRDALNEDDSPCGGLGTEIASLFTTVGLETDIPELRGHVIPPATFS